MNGLDIYNGDITKMDLFDWTEAAEKKLRLEQGNPKKSDLTEKGEERFIANLFRSKRRPYGGGHK